MGNSINSIVRPAQCACLFGAARFDHHAYGFESPYRMRNRGVIGLRSLRPSGTDRHGSAKPSNSIRAAPFGRHSVSRLGGASQKQRAMLGTGRSVRGLDFIDKGISCGSSIKGLKFTDPMSESSLSPPE